MGGGVKNVIEPLAITLIFTATTLINRTRTQGQPRWRPSPPLESEPQERAPLLASKPPLREIPKIAHWLRYPNTTPFQNRPLSRFLQKFPFLLEIWYWALTYWPYQLLRAFSAKYIHRSEASWESVLQTAKENAVRILQVEKWLGIAFEQRFQRFVLKEAWVVDAMCVFYMAHILVGILYLGYSYTYFPRPIYQRARRTLALDNLLAFLILSLYRCTPPRLMPPSYGFVDVLHPSPSSLSIQTQLTHAPNFWANNPFQLTLAAMPSLHFGTSCLLGLTLLTYSPHLWLRILGGLYPICMFLVVIGTANHWVLDCVVGFVLVTVGWHLNWVLLGLRPLEEWGFWCAGVRRPEDEGRKGVLVVGT